MARLYSYIRFSTPEQALGSSLARQAEYAERYAAEHGLQLDTSLSLRDEGLSAYHQAHIKQGALGVFLRAVDDGRVPVGSTLVVEGLDRLSRAEPIVSQALLSQIINAGITVVTAADGKRYDREGLRANPMDLVYSLLVLIRAHEESATKSKRVNASIRLACEDWISGKRRGHIRNGRAPGWLRETGRDVPPLFEVIPERVEAVRHALALYNQGYGAERIITRLRELGLSYRDGPAAVTNFYKMVTSKTLVGVKTIRVDGVDYELPDYYPRVLSDDEFARLRALRVARPAAPAGDIPGIFTGFNLTFCGYCGAAMAGVNYLNRARADGTLADGHRRLLCTAKKSAQRCPHSASASLAVVERALVEYCSDKLDVGLLFGGFDARPEVRAELQRVESRQAELVAQLDKLAAALMLTDTPPLAVMRKMNDLEAEQAQLVAQHKRLGAQLVAGVSPVAADVAEKWQALKGQATALDYDARMQVRRLVENTFNRVECFLSGFNAGQGDDIRGQIAARVLGSQLALPGGEAPLDIVLQFKSGALRLLRINRRSGAWVAQADF